MKNIICLLFLVVTAAMHSQQNSTLLNDPLYLKYEATYISNETNSKNINLENLDEISLEFYSNITDAKSLEGFSKSKDKEKWLTKNLKKTTFNSSEEAISLYKKIESIKAKEEEINREMREMMSELKKKYDGKLIFYTLRERLQNRTN